jgi:cell division protein FtsZ
VIPGGSEKRAEASIAASSARIKVIGVGGGGSNAVSRMHEGGFPGVEFVAANTDLQALHRCRVPVKLELGSELTKGLGAGGDPEIGRKAALEDSERILALLDGSDMVFLTAGLGGGTGTGALPILASLAVESGALTVAVVTKPFGFEGRRRMAHAEHGIEELRGSVDALITIPNERLLSLVERGTPLADAFRIADDVLRQAVRGISDLITVPGEVNVDFADVRSIMTGMGMALMGTGVAQGENRATNSAQRAISSPLLEEQSIEGAKGVLLNISGGRSLTLHEVNEAARIIADSVDPDAQIITGIVIDDGLEEEMKVTVIATGFKHQPEVAQSLDLSRAQARMSVADSRWTEEPTDLPFYKKVVRGSERGEDPAGFSPNWSNVDDYDIPTVLRKQMD